MHKLIGLFVAITLALAAPVAGQSINIYAPNQGQQIKVAAANAAGSIVLPAASMITGILVRNNTASAITGGIKIGTTSGAVNVVAALTVAGSAFVQVTPANVLLTAFSMSASQTLFYDAVVGWNSTNVDIWIIYVSLS